MAEARAVRERYRAVEREEPPPHLDEAIRAAARREAGSRPRLAGSPFGSSWRLPLSIAAIVVVSATLTVMVGEQQRHVPEAEAPPPPAAPVAPPVEQSKPDTATSTPTIRRKAAPAAGPAAPEPELRSNEGSSEQDRRQLPTAPALEEKSAREVAAPPPPRAESEGAPESDAPAAAVEPSRPGQFAEPGAEDSAVGLRKREDHDPRVTPPGRGAGAEAAPQVMATPKPAPRDNVNEQAIARKGLAARLAAPWEHDPVLWLQHIDELRKAGQAAQARASFEAFRKRFPDHKLPTDFVVPPQ